MNPGAEQNAPVGSGASAVFPDLVLHSLERGRRLEAIVEVETGESVNHLEALAEWAHFARASNRVSPVRAVRHGRCRASPLRGQSNRGHRSLELPQRRRRCAVHADSPVQGSTGPGAGAAGRRAAASAPRLPAKAQDRQHGGQAAAAKRAEPKGPRAEVQATGGTCGQSGCAPAQGAPVARRRPGRRNASNACLSVRFSRDKRGYEYVYLVHTPTRRGKPGRARVLYWYRTPPGVRIGRKPFDRRSPADARAAEPRRRVRLGGDHHHARCLLPT